MPGEQSYYSIDHIGYAGFFRRVSGGTASSSFLNLFLTEEHVSPSEE
jgi:hypothetical protein